MAQEADRRQVFDLPSRLIEVIEPQGLVYACACCGGRTAAAFPEGVNAPAQYGERLRAAAVYLHAQQLIPEERTAQTLVDLFGADRLCPASVMDWVRRKAKALAPVAARVGALVAAARVRCLDDPSAMLRTAFVSQARRNGCIRSQPKASRSIASRPGGATWRKALPAAWSSTTASNPMAGSPAPTMRSATPITCANSRR
jgi:transposase